MLSLIVPAYNSINVLPACISSIAVQMRAGIELILVDDGSTDGTGAYCDECAKTHSWIRVLHQKNMGPSTARNLGMSHASGEYLGFIDSDDGVSPDFFDTIFAALSQDSVSEGGADLFVYGFEKLRKHEGSLSTERLLPGISGHVDRMTLLNRFGELYQAWMINPIWNKIYKRDLIQQWRIQFPTERTLGEDLLFNIAYLEHCGKIQVINKAIYRYLAVGDASLTRGYKKNFFESQRDMHLAVVDFLKANQVLGDNRACLAASYEGRIFSCLDNEINRRIDARYSEIREQIGRIITDDSVCRMHEGIGFLQSAWKGRLLRMLLATRAEWIFFIFFRLGRRFARYNRS